MEAFQKIFPAQNFSLIAVILAMPLLGAFVNGVFGKRLGKDAVRLMTLTAMAVSFLAAVFTFLALDEHVGQTATKILVDGHETTQHGYGKLVWRAWEWM